MKTKVCKKCGIEKPLTEFYKHPSMGDGYLGKCKDCTKDDVHRLYMDKINDPSFVENERTRGRDKYHRLYSGIKHPKRHPENGSTRRYFENNGVIMDAEYEVHHWNYNYPHNAFVLTGREHSRLHKQLLFNKSTKCFTYNGVILDTVEKHTHVITEVLGIMPLYYEFNLL